MAARVEHRGCTKGRSTVQQYLTVMRMGSHRAGAVACVCVRAIMQRQQRLSKHMPVAQACCPHLLPMPVQGIRAQVGLSVHKDDICNAIREDQSLGAIHGQLS